MRPSRLPVSTPRSGDGGEHAQSSLEPKRAARYTATGSAMSIFDCDAKASGRSGPSCQLLVNSQPERSLPAEFTTGENYQDVEKKGRHVAAFSSSTSHGQLMQTRKKEGGEMKKEGGRKVLLDTPHPAAPLPTKGEAASGLDLHG